MERELLLIRGPVLATTPIVQAVNRFPDTLLANRLGAQGSAVTASAPPWPRNLDRLRPYTERMTAGPDKARERALGIPPSATLVTISPRNRS